MDIVVPSSGFSIVSHLLSDENKNKFNPFIYQTVKLFIDKKKQVTLDMHSTYLVFQLKCRKCI